MTTDEMTALVTVGIQETPAIISAVKSLFTSSNPTATVPTDADVIKALNDAFLSSLAVDEQWLAVHPA